MRSLPDLSRMLLRGALPRVRGHRAVDSVVVLLLIACYMTPTFMLSESSDATAEDHLPSNIVRFGNVTTRASTPASTTLATAAFLRTSLVSPRLALALAIVLGRESTSVMSATAFGSIPLLSSSVGAILSPHLVMALLLRSFLACSSPVLALAYALIAFVKQLNEWYAFENSYAFAVHMLLEPMLAFIRSLLLYTFTFILFATTGVQRVLAFEMALEFVTATFVVVDIFLNALDVALSGVTFLHASMLRQSRRCGRALWSSLSLDMMKRDNVNDDDDDDELGGYPVHLFESTETASAFHCSICLDVAFESVTTPCGHLFCERCLLRALHERPCCPMDRQPVSHDDVEQNLFVRRLIRQQRVHCAHERAGCPWGGTLLQLEQQHLRHCTFSPRQRRRRRRRSQTHPKHGGDVSHPFRQWVDDDDAERDYASEEDDDYIPSPDESSDDSAGSIPYLSRRANVTSVF